MNKNICPALNHALCVDASGSLTRCCVNKSSSESFKTVSEVEDIQDYFQNDPLLRKLKEYNTQGIWPEECVVCQKKEEAGIISRREKYHRWYPNIDDDFTRKYPDDVVHMDISFGNTCNQQCVMCNSNFSSKWLKDDIETINQGLDFREKKFMNLKNWSLSYQQIDQIVDYIGPRTTTIEIKGGEPLFDKKLPYFVEKILSKNENIRISIITNGTQFNDRTIPILKQIPNLILSVSIDGVKDTYEWIRSTEWKETELSFQRCLSEVRNAKIFLATTVMIYNINQLKDLYNWTWAQKENYSFKDLAIGFPQVVTHPKPLQVKYASRERLIEASDDIDYIIEDPGKITIPKNSYESNLKKFIEKALNEEVDKSVFWDFHSILAGIRGWDIADHANL